MIVVDASAAVDALTMVEGTEALHARLTSDELAAPELLDYEVVSAIRGLVLGAELSVERAFDALTDFDDLDVRRWASADPLRRRAFELRANVSAYDAAYVTLAEALDCALVTRDGRLARSCGHLISVEVL